MLGLCACGGSSGDSADAVLQYQPMTKDEAEAEVEAEPEVPCLKGYTTDEIMAAPEEATGSNALSVSWPEVDASELMTTYVIEFEDYDGYTIRETCQLSPIFRHEDREIMYGLWEALGEDAGYFPMEEDFYDASYLLENSRDKDSCNELEYIIRTFMVENLTDGYRYDELEIKFGDANNFKYYEMLKLSYYE